MRLQRQAGGLVVGDDVLAQRHQRQRRGVLPQPAGAANSGSRSRQAAHLPERLPPIQPQAAHRIGVRQGNQRRMRQPRSAPDRQNCQHDPCSQKRPPSPGGSPMIRRNPSRSVPPVLHRAIPRARANVDAAHGHAVLARVAHDLRRRVEPHRLRIQQRAGERRRMVAFQPGRDIDQHARNWRRGSPGSRRCRNPRSGGSSVRRSRAS